VNALQAAFHCELRLVEDDIRRLTVQHLGEIGGPSLHAKPCGRPDLHERMAALHARAAELWRQLASTIT